MPLKETTKLENNNDNIENVKIAGSTERCGSALIVELVIDLKNLKRKSFSSKNIYGLLKAMIKSNDEGTS